MCEGRGVDNPTNRKESNTIGRICFSGSGEDIVSGAGEGSGAVMVFRRRPRSCVNSSSHQAPKENGSRYACTDPSRSAAMFGVVKEWEAFKVPSRSLGS